MCDCGNFSILEYIERGFSRFLYPWWHPKLGHIGRMLGDRRCRVSPLSLETSRSAFSVLGVSVCNHAAHPRIAEGRRVGGLQPKMHSLRRRSRL